ncbi:MAG: ribosome-associated translation inhibitor RaiA [Clostridiales bacterium]|jgi:putative sigma-54 modulation protein|nr:ribosome-associated translation inhibitor RaiA [Clostridiales bacterium]
MKYIFVGKSMEVGSRLKERAVKKLGKLEKFFSPETEAVVTMSIQKNWHIFELTIAQSGITFRAEEKSDDMYVSIDKAVDIIERQIRKNKTRLSRRIHESAFKSIEDFDDSRYIVEEQDYRVLRTKKFPVKPMTADEAILQMNLLSHEFFVFVNSETKQTNVVYKRKDDSYGLIEPEK